MRVISGEFKGRVFNPPSNLRLRPTTDRAKESLFNILNNYVDFRELKVLDLFAGTGNISYEYISRGVVDITMVERDPKCVAFIQDTLKKLEVTNVDIVRTDVFRFIDDCPDKFDLIFADPPYSLSRIQEIPTMIFQNGLLKKDGLIIIEHGSRITFDEEENFYRKRNIGEVNFSIFRG
ncbi:MAG: 16S rRNA (guanine(966)-N(2))-methyltransferase RsmD [Bacteroidetes bacterium]|nr:MAG: 16S rRNA (guanine(966)-N(2))-methyltransferase RsmD [Bacteroidota bacterium]